MMIQRISRTLVHPSSKFQRRGFLDWMTNNPDNIMELKKAHQAVDQSVETWNKYSSDAYVNAVGAALAATALVQLSFIYYRLATGKGKIE